MRRPKNKTQVKSSLIDFLQRFRIIGAEISMAVDLLAKVDFNNTKMLKAGKDKRIPLKTGLFHLVRSSVITRLHDYLEQWDRFHSDDNVKILLVKKVLQPHIKCLKSFRELPTMRNQYVAHSFGISFETECTLTNFPDNIYEIALINQVVFEVNGKLEKIFSNEINEALSKKEQLEIPKEKPLPDIEKFTKEVEKIRREVNTVVNGLTSSEKGMLLNPQT